MDGERPCAGWSHFLLNQRAGQRQDWDNHQEPADQHGHTQCGVVPKRVSIETGKGAAVVTCGRAEGIKNFAQPMRTIVVQAG